MHESPCLEIFLPIFNGLADLAKYHSSVCRKTATSKLQSLKRKENEGFRETAEEIKNPLNSCNLDSVNDLEYFKCIADKADQIAAYFKQIEGLYSDMLRNHTEEMQRINEEELICLEQVVEKSKFETDLAHENFQKCTISGKWPSSPSSNNDQQQDYKEDPLESEDKKAESLNKISIPITIGVPVGLAIIVSTIFIGTVIYKSKKIHGHIMNAGTNLDI